jgi:glycosyltransferase involved in cell wall biosynthesis
VRRKELGMTRRLRVAHVINTLGLGGVPAVAWQLLRALPGERYTSLLHVLAPGQGESAARAARRATFEEIGVPVHLAPAYPPALDDGAGADGRAGTAQPSQAAATWHRVAALAQWLRRERVDLVHTHSYKPNLHGRLAAALLQREGVRVVAHYHNEYSDKWDLDRSDILERELAASTDALLACSAAVARHVEHRLALPAGRVQLLSNGVDTAVFHRRDRQAARAALGWPLDRPLVAIVGRISEQKAQDDFLRAAAQVAQARPEVVFLVVGSSDSPALSVRLSELAAALNLGPERLRFTGHVDGAARMAEVYSAIDLLVAPSRWEGFGLMLVEAMACGTPIVATRVGAIPDVVEHGRSALLVAPGDGAALAQAMSQLLSDDPLCARLSAGGPVRARQFSWQASADRLATLYDTLLPSRLIRGPHSE